MGLGAEKILEDFRTRRPGRAEGERNGLARAPEGLEDKTKSKEERKRERRERRDSLWGMSEGLEHRVGDR